MSKEGAWVHAIVLSRNPNFTEGTQTVLGRVIDQWTVATSWPEVTYALARENVDLVIVDRAALTQIRLSNLLGMTEPGRWPALLLLDAPSRETALGPLVEHLGPAEPRFHQVGELRIDTRRKRAGINGRWVTLPPIQYRLLVTLAERPGEVIDCQELLRRVWGYEGGETEARELLKVHIRQLRRRLGLDPATHPYIRSVRGFGYMLAAPGDE
ncbi:MAG: response regulator transcription factor [Chloroflexi bacterium]|nr:response regulator transcription factor [Chloroflexota bacterium]